MRASNSWIVLTFIAATLMAIASAAGILSVETYARETVSWAAQGAGQDFVNLLVVFPVLVGSAVEAQYGRADAHLVWIGSLLYLVYSYVLYAFFVHFGPWFPVYVAVLGSSAYALAGAASGAKARFPRPQFGRVKHARGAAIFLMAFGCGFAALWLAEIVPALAAGRAPASVVVAGGAVNPVHVLDLALFLPGTIATGVLLWKRRPLGFLCAVPVLVFASLMGLAVMAMTLVMRARGLPAPLGTLPVFAAASLCSAWFASTLMREMRGEAQTPRAPRRSRSALVAH